MHINKKAFTILEILIVVASIAVLASIVVVAINPGKQLAQARNAQRRADVSLILSAVYQYSSENNGVIPGDVETTEHFICISPDNCTANTNLSVLTNGERYLAAMPLDPTNSTEMLTGYTIVRSPEGHVTVRAPYAELGEDISITR